MSILIKSQLFYALNITQVFQELSSGLSEARMKCFWINFAKRYQDKGSLVKVGVRYVKVFTDKFFPIEEQDI